MLSKYTQLNCLSSLSSVLGCWILVIANIGLLPLDFLFSGLWADLLGQMNKSVPPPFSRKPQAAFLSQRSHWMQTGSHRIASLPVSVCSLFPAQFSGLFKSHLVSECRGTHREDSWKRLLSAGGILALEGVKEMGKPCTRLELASLHFHLLSASLNFSAHE